MTPSGGAVAAHARHSSQGTSTTVGIGTSRIGSPLPPIGSSPGRMAERVRHGEGPVWSPEGPSR